MGAVCAWRFLEVLFREQKVYLFVFGKQYLVLRFAKSLEQNLKPRPLKSTSSISRSLSLNDNVVLNDYVNYLMIINASNSE